MDANQYPWPKVEPVRRLQSKTGKWGLPLHDVDAYTGQVMSRYSRSLKQEAVIAAEMEREAILESLIKLAPALFALCGKALSPHA
ncbi:MAG: hypothetical protein LKE96_10350 [Acetobacter peroxydans]|jgi:hypothetical protein|nr:hypothetical protein [Acetobacter peroxydans]